VKQFFVWRFICLAAVLLGCTGRPAAGNQFAQLQSAYLGNGWFQYTLTSQPDPFWQEADLQEFVVPGFPNIVSVGGNPADWQNQTNSGASADWWFTGTPPQARPYQRVFLVQSAYTNYCTSTNGAMLTAFVNPANYFVSGTNVETKFEAAYGTMGCLVPCQPAQADGSLAAIVSTFQLYPDIVINGFLTISNNPCGLTYTWGSGNYTVLAQGSPDLQNWTNIAYALGSPPSSTWTSPVPLSAYGNFYRLQLVATYLDSNLVGQAGGSAVSPAASAKPAILMVVPRILSCTRASNGDIAVQISTDIGAAYQLYIADSNNQVYDRTNILIDGNVATAMFNSATSPNPGIIHDVVLP
jgi:hypothetical protein